MNGLLLQIRADSDLQQLLDRVRVAIYKRRVRSTEFFKDYDKLRSGVVTVNQFMAALVLAIGKEAQLTETELVKIVNFYKTPDGRVEYREFCDMLENGRIFSSVVHEIFLSKAIQSFMLVSYTFKGTI